MCENHEKSRLRDREFDSAVRADLEAAQGGPVESNQSHYAEQRGNINAGREGFAYEARPTPSPQSNAEAQLRNSPFGHAATAILNANGAITHALISGERGTFNAAKRAADVAVTELLTPYYEGRGNFAGARFLSDLEAFLCRPPTEAEVKLFGALVGNWLGERHAAEVEAQFNEVIEQGGSDSYVAQRLASIAQNALEDVSNARSL